jgi:multidrug efflux pump subunit AcrA (membrane-fusion protein)
MDRQRPASKSRSIKLIAAASVAVFVIIGGGVTLANIDFSTRRVDGNKVTIETVQRGTMEVKVSANGQLLSKSIEDIAAQVAGRVARKQVKPGDSVAAGQVLVELTNSQLIATAEEAYSAWEGAVADQQSSEAQMQNLLLEQEANVSQAHFNLERAQLQLDAETRLIGQHIIAEIDYKRTQLNVAQLTKGLAIEETRLQRARDNLQAQMAVKRSRVTQSARALDRARSQVERLKVVAGIGGVVQAINTEVGQELQPGTPIGRIAEQDQLYAQLRVPAREAGEVATGQNVLIDTRSGTVKGVVTRIDPGVTDGTVIVDADIEGRLPRSARPQLQIEGIIYVTQLADTVYVGKPAYVKTDASIAVYKLDAAGRYAQRVNVQVGKISSNYVQVVSGLRAGDRIITSEPGAWQDQRRILLD